MSRARATALVVATFTGALLPRAAHADLFLTREGESVVPVARRVVLEHHGKRETFVEELDVTSTSPRFVWVRAFPVAPRVKGGREELFDTLDQGTIVEEPFNEQIRRNLFGPSVVTVLTHRLIGDGPPPEEPKEEPQRKMQLEEPRIFTGKVTTSTITYKLVLPEELDAFLDEQGLTVSEEQKREVARYLNRDWILVGTVVADGAPSDSQRARIGPLRYDFDTDAPLYPQMGLDRPWLRTPSTDFYLIAGEPLAPETLRTVWDARSWERRPKPRSEFIATYAHPLDPESTIAYELRESEIGVPDPAVVVRGSYERGGEAQVDLSFMQARDAVVMPGSDRRKSGTDIFLCILLGLTPLIYTPESWFLLWLAARAKARARKEGKAFGTRLWSVYAILVAIFWFATLEGAGRLAALAPMLIGIAQLAIPYAERDPHPIRAQFKKRKPQS